MRHAQALTVLLLVVGSSAFAADLGRAIGSVTIDGKPIVLQYAYAIDHQKNQLSNKTSDTKIILTDKPLPEGTKLDDVDYTFPDGVFGIVVCVTAPADGVSHVVVQHPTGTYDAGYFEGVQDYRFKRIRGGDRGTIGGALSSKKITTNTMSFFFDAEFAAQVQ